MSECSPSTANQNALSHDAIASQLGFLQGEILTIVDAAFADKDQRKAVKDLVRFQFKRRIRYIEQLCFGSTAESSINPYNNISSETVVQFVPEFATQT